MCAAMKWFREGKWITVGFIASLLVMGIMNLTSYQNSVHLINSANQAQQTNELLDALTDISTILADAEARHWNYILFKNPEDLSRYNAAVDRLMLILARIHLPLTDTTIQQQRLEILEELINERIRLFEQSIAYDIEQYEGFSSHNSLVHRTQENYKEIQQIIALLEQTEEELIAVQIDEVRKNSRIRMVIEPAGTILSFSILLGVFGSLYRQSLKRQKAEAAQRALVQQKELSELKLQLFSMVSHEFRTPLSLILGSSQLLEERLKNEVSRDRLKSLYRIQSSAKLMTQLLNDILMVSRADAGKLDFAPNWIEIQGFCLNLIEDFQEAHTGHYKFLFEQYGDRTYAYVDEKLLYSILSNLLSNAVKFSPQNSTISLVLINQQSAILFQVHDSGVGISEMDQERLYEPFIRGSNVGQTKGTGLGLAVVQRCVLLHAGSISVKSQVGHGTTFSVTIPQPENIDKEGFFPGKFLKGAAR